MGAPGYRADLIYQKNYLLLLLENVTGERGWNAALTGWAPSRRVASCGLRKRLPPVLTRLAMVSWQHVGLGQWRRRGAPRMRSVALAVLAAVRLGGPIVTSTSRGQAESWEAYAAAAPSRLAVPRPGTCPPPDRISQNDSVRLSLC